MHREVKLGDFYPKKNKSVNPKNFQNEIFELFSIPAYDDGKAYLLKGKEIGSSKKLLQGNDVVLSRIIPHIRRCWTIPNNNSYRKIGSGEWIIFRSGKFDTSYLRHYLMSDIFNKKFMSTVKGVGGSLLRADPKQVANFKIPLPPLPEQQRIARLLDEADKLRQLNQHLIQKYEQLTQSLFLEMFGDPVTNPKGWEKVEMKDLMTIVRGGSPRPIKNFLGGNIPWIKIGDGTKGNDIYINKTKEHIIESGIKKSRFLPKGSLIFANCGVSLGFARIITFKGCIHDGWLAFSEFDNRLNKIYLLKLLNSITRYFRETAPDGTQPNLNTKIMSSFKIILPPVELQNKFEKMLFEVEKQKQQAQEALQKSEDLFNSLLQEVFKG